MGRSVGTATDALAVVFLHFLPEDPEDTGWEWDMFLDDIRDTIQHRYPSLEHAGHDNWHDREGRILLENEHAHVVVYSYSGVVSVNLVPRKHDGYHDDVMRSNMATGWCRRVEAGFRERLTDGRFEVLEPLGFMSNGGRVYRFQNANT